MRGGHGGVRRCGRRADARESPAATGDPEAGVGLRRCRGQRLARDWRARRAWRRGRFARGGRASDPRRYRHRHGLGRLRGSPRRTRRVGRGRRGTARRRRSSDPPDEAAPWSLRAALPSSVDRPRADLSLTNAGAPGRHIVLCTTVEPRRPSVKSVDAFAGTVDRAIR